MSRPAELTGLDAFFARCADAYEEACAAAGGAATRTLRVAGLTVELRFAGEALARTLTRGFGARATAGPPDDDPGATIELWAGPLEVPWGNEDVSTRGLVAGSTGGAGGAIAVHERGSSAVTLFSADRRRILHRVPSVERIPWWERAAPLRPALFWALGGERRRPVHGGAVGDERGGVLLGGAGGSGKTTTALASLAHGLRYAGDDYVLLDLGDEGAAPTAHNLFGTAKLDDGHLPRFPELAGLARRTGDPEPNEKWVIDVARERPEALAEALPIRAVVVPRIAGGRARIEPLPGSRALLALAPSTIFQMPYEGAATFPLLSAVARAVPCWSLAVGDDPAELGPLIERVLDEAAA